MLSPNKGHIFIVSGPSGVGKDCTISELKKLPGYSELNMTIPKSYTTRQPREGNPNDANYIFVTEKEFTEKLEQGEILESTVSHGDMYGSSLSDFEKCLEEGHNILKVFDKNGSRLLKTCYPQETTTIWMKPPSLKILAERLKNRKSETAFTFAKRMRDSIIEMQDVNDYDYILTNIDLKHSAEEILLIIQHTLDQKARGIGIFSDISLLSDAWEEYDEIRQ